MAQSNIAKTVNQLVAELISLNNAEPDFYICAEIIVNTINEIIIELINLTGIESSFSVAISAEIIMIIRCKETIEELLTEILTLKSNAEVTRLNVQSSAVAETNIDLDVIALSIALLVAAVTAGTVSENVGGIADGNNDRDKAIAELVRIITFCMISNEVFSTKIQRILRMILSEWLEWLLTVV